MNSLQEAKLNMYRATQKHCNDNMDVVNSISAFSTTLTAFNAKVSAIISAAQQEELVTKGITMDKSDAKKALCYLAADTAAPIFALASATGNKKLKQEVNFSFSDLFKIKDDILSPCCQNIMDAGMANIDALKPYGLTAAGLTAFQAAIDSYQQKVPTPRNSAAQKKTVRENLKKLMAETDAMLKDQMDKTIVGFKLIHPDFVSTYKANRVIIDPGTSSTTLKGTVLSATDKSSIGGATILIIETGNKTTTHQTGAYEIKPVPAGNYTINISAPKYKDKTEKEVTIKQGQNTTLNFVLDPA